MERHAGLDSDAELLDVLCPTRLGSEPAVLLRKTPQASWFNRTVFKLVCPPEGGLSVPPSALEPDEQMQVIHVLRRTGYYV